jgi:hypothetical protein
MQVYALGATPQTAHEEWKKNWKPPVQSPFALKGKACVEFGPFAGSSALWIPEKQSFTAIMVDDSADEVPVGTEVAIGAIDGDQFEHEGRKMCFVKRSDILLMEVTE